MIFFIKFSICGFSNIEEIVSESNDYSSETNNNINEEFIKSLNLSSHLHTILTYLFNRSDICTDDLRKNYKKISSLEELYEYSSKGFLDMSSFSSCIKNDSNNFFSFYQFGVKVNFVKN